MLVRLQYSSRSLQPFRSKTARFHGPTQKNATVLQSTFKAFRTDIPNPPIFSPGSKVGLNLACWRMRFKIEGGYNFGHCSNRSQNALKGIFQRLNPISSFYLSPNSLKYFRAFLLQSLWGNFISTNIMEIYLTRRDILQS